MKICNSNPLVTFVVLSYNQEKFIKNAIQGALNQDYSNLEFIFSDDCSTDKTSIVIQSILNEYRGPHKVVINKNQNNLGLADHFNKVLKLANGEIVVVAAGDDISLPDRVSKTIQLFLKNPRATFVSFSDVVINTNGEIILQSNYARGKEVKNLSLNEYLVGHKLELSGASRAYRKKVFDLFGPLYSSCPTEDSPYLLRCLMLGYGLVSTEVGIYYRRHENNLSSMDNIHQLNLKNIKRQYLRDVYFAHRSKLITKDQKRRIIDWIYKTITTREVVNKLFFNEPKPLILIWLIRKYKKISINTLLRMVIFVLKFKK